VAQKFGKPCFLPVDFFKLSSCLDQPKHLIRSIKEHQTHNLARFAAIVIKRVIQLSSKRLYTPCLTLWCGTLEK